MKGVVIGGTRSGVGKTVATLVIIRALQKQGYTVQPAKAGPDFIDPSHHERVAGQLSRTLDRWLQGEDGLRRNYPRGHPINTTKRIFLVLPHGVDHHEGFYEAIHIVKRLASKLGTPVTVLVVGGETSQYQRLFGLVGHEVAAEFEPIGWDVLLDSLSERTAENDLIVAVSPREGEVGWHDELNELPSRLVELPPHSFVMIYPRHGEPEYAARFLRFD